MRRDITPEWHSPLSNFTKICCCCCSKIVTCNQTQGQGESNRRISVDISANSLHRKETEWTSSDRTALQSTDHPLNCRSWCSGKRYRRAARTQDLPIKVTASRAPSDQNAGTFITQHSVFLLKFPDIFTSAGTGKLSSALHGGCRLIMHGG